MRSELTCEEVREALPVLAAEDGAHEGDGPDGADEASIRVHAASCPPCARLVEAYEADEAALEAYRRDRRVPAGLLDGLADDVLTRVAADERARRVLALGPSSRRLGLELVLAVAALLLVAVALRLAATPAEPPAPPGGDSRTALRPDAPPATDGELHLPSPRLDRDTAPMPRLVRRGVVPADEGSGGGPSRDLMDLLERSLLPRLDPRRGGQPPATGREVRF